jgi:adenosylmethionine-8-amino-7-oxononanoate aminotransferase
VDATLPISASKNGAVTDRDLDRDALAFDREHLWHPYTSMRDPLPVYPVVRARGVRLELADGRTLVDGMSSWWCAIHGYDVPALNEALREQLERMAHVMFGGLTHAPAIALGRLLTEIAPRDSARVLDRVFFADSGSVAVEVAIKMVLQAQHARGRADKRRLLTVRGGYHGDTFGAMAVCDPVTGMHALFQGVLAPHLFAELPGPAFDAAWDEGAIASFERLLAAHAHELAAVILEPIVQGAGGMRFYHPEYLRRVRAACDAHDVLLVADEIATGFGRTGRLFACEHAGIAPDILCLGKALTGGYLSLAATLTTSQVADTISRGPAGGTFMHGPTFMANPLGCAVGLASVRALLRSPWQDRIRRIEAQLRDALLPLATAARVREARVLGAIGVVEMKDPVDVAAAQRGFVEDGAWIRPFGRLVYLMPPYVIAPDDLARLTGAVARFVRG